MKIFLVSLLLLICASVSLTETKKAESVKEKSFITYKITHPLHEIESTSKSEFCSIDFDPAAKQIKDVTVDVDVTTFDSGNSNRDSHAMEVIDALTYPDSKFISTGISQDGNKMVISGKLTFHGITKDIKISAVSRWTDKTLEVDGSFDISLTEFKIERPSLLLIPVEDKLKFSFVELFNLESTPKTK